MEKRKHLSSSESVKAIYWRDGIYSRKWKGRFEFRVKT